MNDSKTIDSFSGEYDWLSNFYPVSIYYKGLYWQTSEHAYQASKTMIPGEMDWVRNCRTPGQAKRMASKKKGKITLRPGWDSMRYDVMVEVLREKFKNPTLWEKLCLTFGKVLIEGNQWHDNYWGNCYCPECENIEGLNMLGMALTQVRGELFGSNVKNKYET